MSFFSSVEWQREPMDVSRAKLAERFQWPTCVLRSLEQQLGHSSLLASALCQMQGSCSDFSGGCSSWEVASAMLEAAVRKDASLTLDLGVRSICDPWSGFHEVLGASSELHSIIPFLGFFTLGPSGN